jgi:RNA polymerase sigma factor (sigma-70 family)
LQLTDADLIARVLVHDDRHAFSELVRRHQSAVRSFLRRLTRDQYALADDLAQETFIEAYRSLAKFRGGSQLATWLLGIAYNRFRNELRRRRETETFSEDAAMQSADADRETSAPAPNRAVELQHDLTAALARLSADEQAAIHLCFQEGLTHDEAATALGCPLGTVKTHVLRAKEKLRNYLRAWAPA